MQHGYLVGTYNKAQKLFYNKKFRRAKKLFEKITSEIYSSDTDCMADIQICGSAEEYLQEIETIDFWKFYRGTINTILLFILVLFVLVYFIIKTTYE